MPPVQLELKEVIQTMKFSLSCDMMTNSRERMCDNATICCGHTCSKCAAKYQEIVRHNGHIIIMDIHQ